MDPVVFWLNTQLMQSYWASQVPSASVSYLDLESARSAGDPYGQQTAFTWQEWPLRRMRSHTARRTAARSLSHRPTT
jgi:hypothetical protein